LRTAHGVIRICIGVALLTLALLFAVSGSDYATREMHPAPWQPPASVGMAGQGR
jgi:cytochrome c oxidase subunit 4